MKIIYMIYETLDYVKTPIRCIDDINVKLYNHNSWLNILHTNIRSINKHLNQLEHLYISLNEKCQIIVTSATCICKD
jgi:hypothetical protein